MKIYAPRLRHLALAGLSAVSVLAQAGLTVPAYNSRPGAAYTIYLDLGGFSFSGTWGTSGRTPGTTPAYTVDGNATTFSTSELANIKTIWARTAEKYTAFNVNVTTVDPAVAAGRATSDAMRQSFYDSTPQTMHTVVGGGGTWYGNAGGVSYLGVTQNAQTTNGYHTNWVFAAESPTNLQFISEASAHENGHGLRLNHQSDLTQGTTSTFRQYSAGDGSGNGSYAPVMGYSYEAQRGLLRDGTYDSTGNGTVGSRQNDVRTLLTNANMTTLLDDNIGHSLATATALALNGTTLNTAINQGFIASASSTAPTAIGRDNYTKDYYKFLTNGSAISLKLNAGAQRITTGVADIGATFDGFLNILDANGTLIATGARSSDTLSSLYTATLAAGTYYAQIVSYGGYHSTRESTANNSIDYFTGGSYFLSGSGGFQAVPEPATWAALGLGALAVLRRRRRSA